MYSFLERRLKIKWLFSILILVGLIWLEVSMSAKGISASDIKRSLYKNELFCENIMPFLVWLVKMWGLYC